MVWPVQLARALYLAFLSEYVHNSSFHVSVYAYTVTGQPVPALIHFGYAVARHGEWAPGTVVDVAIETNGGTHIPVPDEVR
jgi:hypothetical protein